MWLWGLRRKRNLLLANGHPNAGLYTLGKLNDEAALVIERENNRLANEAVMLKSAAAAIFSEDGHKLLMQLVDRLREE